MTKKKKITYSILSVVLVALCVWVGLRWKVWFGQPEEEAYKVSEKPWRVMLTFGDGDENSRNVSWQCGDSVVEDAYVELDPLRLPHEGEGENPKDSDFERPSVLPPVGELEGAVKAKGEVFQSRAGKAAYYVAKLRNLTPNHRYRYRAVVGGKASEWHEFRTYPANDDALSFIFVGDVQDTIGGAANKFIKSAFAAHKDAEFLVSGGDLTERPRDANWAETFRSLEGIGTRYPVLTITGNHDYLKELPRKLERRFSLVFSYFLDSMVGENQVFSQRYGNAEFFLLDSDRELPYLLEQKEWLEKALDSSTAKWKIVLIHHPLYSLRGSNNLIQRWVFDDLIREKKVDLVLQGHEHNYGRMLADHSHTPLYTVSHCSPKTYSHKKSDYFDKVITDSRFYQYVKIKGDTLEMSAYKVYDNKRIDFVRLSKNKK